MSQPERFDPTEIALVPDDKLRTEVQAILRSFDADADEMDNFVVMLLRSEVWN
jgi:hypothetical protein